MLNDQVVRDITDKEVNSYQDDGAVLLSGIFDTDWIELLSETVDLDKLNPGPMVRYNTPVDRSGEFFVDFQLWLRWDGARRFVTESPAASIAARMMGAKSVNFYHDHLLIKEPSTAEKTPWHHDQPYYPIDGDMIGSIWLPLDYVSKEISVEYIAGSHRWGRWFAPQYFDSKRTSLSSEKDIYETIPEIDLERHKYRFLQWAVEPGDCIFFHGLTVHGAPGNPSTAKRRRAYATRWLGEDTRFGSRNGRISPPITGHGLSVGDRMDCEMFPRIWPKS